ncbi:hypothetical protein J8273_6594 [Carpediemonas membranifera]|uniref:Uncharacterized protein n=1 Tax=Carpediemonas membranifera TaxID=201153 RepID=A0A8J6DYC8_9EUKA|nr:hypothetical protein J8273_6594 [Carpediemonas membranifera]|eukprot:KAG9392004.1 hypothetical protein J8273_6594 [Carpediemonas membranifera]
MIELPLQFQQVSFALSSSYESSIRLASVMYLSDILSSQQNMEDDRKMLDLFIEHDIASLIGRQLCIETSAPVLDAMMELIASLVLLSFDATPAITPSPSDKFIQSGGLKGVQRCMLLMDAVLSYRSVMVLRVLAQYGRPETPKTSIPVILRGADNKFISNLFRIIEQPVSLFMDSSSLRDADLEAIDSTIHEYYSHQPSDIGQAFAARRVEVAILLSLLLATDRAFRKYYRSCVKAYPTFSSHIRKIIVGTLDRLSPAHLEDGLLQSASPVPGSERDAANLMNDPVPIRALFAPYMEATPDERVEMDLRRPASAHPVTLGFLMKKLELDTANKNSPDVRGAHYLASVISMRAHEVLQGVGEERATDEATADLLARKRDLDIEQLPRLPLEGRLIAAALAYEILAHAARDARKKKTRPPVVEQQAEVRAEEHDSPEQRGDETEQEQPQLPQPAFEHRPTPRLTGTHTASPARPLAATARLTPKESKSPYPLRDPTCMRRMGSPARPQPAEARDRGPARPLLRDLVPVSVNIGDILHAETPGSVAGLDASLTTIKRKVTALQKENLIAPLNDAKARGRRPFIALAVRRLKAQASAISQLVAWLVGDEHANTKAGVRAVLAARLGPVSQTPTGVKLALTALDTLSLDADGLVDLVAVIGGWMSESDDRFVDPLTLVGRQEAAAIEAETESDVPEPQPVPVD